MRRALSEPCDLLMNRRPSMAPRRWLRAGLLLAALGFGSVLLAVSPWMVALSFFAAGLGMGLCFPSVSALASTRFSPGEQPACAATMSTAQGMSMVLARCWAPVPTSCGRPRPSC